MLSHDEWRQVLGDRLTDAEIEEVARSLRNFIGQFLDNYFKEEFDDGGEGV
jgi:hypothetical protein